MFLFAGFYCIVIKDMDDNVGDKVFTSIVKRLCSISFVEPNSFSQKVFVLTFNNSYKLYIVNIYS